MGVGAARDSTVRSVRAWLQVAKVAGQIAQATPVVVARRLILLSTAGPQRRRREADRMVREKVEAAGEILLVLATAGLPSGARTAHAALLPVHRRVVANRDRLRRR